MLLGMAECNWQVGENGARGYQKKEYLDGVNIFYEPAASNEYKVWLEMSGKGCRNFETMGNGEWEKLFALVCNEPENIHLTRLDVAYDDKPISFEEWQQLQPEARALHTGTGLLDLKIIQRSVDDEAYVSRIRCLHTETSYRRVLNKETGTSERRVGRTVYAGSPQSNMLIRIYDKAIEQETYPADFHWVRLEMQLRNENALGFVYALANDNIGTVFSGVLANYLRFVEPDPKDSNRSRWRTVDWWQEILGDVGRISIWITPGNDYTTLRLENFVTHNCGNAIQAYIDMMGIERFLRKLKENRPPQMAEKYKVLLAQNGLYAEDDISFWLNHHYREGQRYKEVDFAVMEALRDYQFRKALDTKLREQHKDAQADALWR